MKSILYRLYRPWIIKLLGIGLLSILIWFAGPLLTYKGKNPLISPESRMLCVGALFALLIASIGARKILNKISNITLTKYLLSNNKESSTQAGLTTEISELKVQLLKIVELLRNSINNKKKEFYLYRTPWYVLIGGPHAGKTTLLIQSGLKFLWPKVFESQSLEELRKSQYCYSLLSEEAVFFNIAGHHLPPPNPSLNAPPTNETSVWQFFLQFLKKCRARRPVNGAIIVVSIEDFLQKSDSERQLHALEIRERIKESHTVLNIQFPIYFILTKLDLLPGFIEFFDYLNAEERKQVWGITFPLLQNEGNQVDQNLIQFPAEFNLLKNHLEARLIDRLQQSNPKNQALVYDFPQRFAALGESLEKFINEIFTSSQYEKPALLRGIYFTGAAREQSYFVTNILRKVIFQESEVGSINLNFERHRRLIRGLALTVILLLLTASGSGLVMSYLRNTQYIENISARIQDINQQLETITPESSIEQILPVLDVARDLYENDADRIRKNPFLIGLGLYPGGKLNAGAHALYHRLLESTLLPKIINKLEMELQRGNANNPEYLYQTLRVYLILGDPHHFDLEALKNWIAEDLERTTTRFNSAQRDALFAHLNHLFLHEEDFKTLVGIDKDLVEKTQSILTQISWPVYIYRSLQLNYESDPLPSFNIQKLVGLNAFEVLTRRSGEPLNQGVLGFYTLAGYQRFIDQSNEILAKLAKDAWVFDEQVDFTKNGLEKIKVALQQRYFDNYIQQWDRFLADIEIVPFTSFAQGAQVLKTLYSPDSPWLKLLREASKQTMLTPVESEVLSQTISSEKKVETLEKNSPAFDPVTAHFQYLHEMFKPGQDLKSSFSDQTLQNLEALKQLSVFFEKADNAKQAGQPLPGSDALTQLKPLANSQTGPMRALLNYVDAYSASLMLGSEQARLNALWKLKAAPFCRQAIHERYPLTRLSNQDITLEDFGRFFAPGGLVDEFFQVNLLPYVDMSKKTWQWQKAGNVSLGMEKSTLNKFQIAAQIRDELFKNNNKLPSLQFKLRLLKIDESVSEMLLIIDGQTLAYEKGAETAGKSFQIPSGVADSNGQVHLSIITSDKTIEKTIDGPWAWFRLLDQGNLEATSHLEKYTFNLEIEGAALALELTANSVINPFNRKALEQFRCLDNL